MHNSKLIKILKTLSPEEFRLLKKFLRSPFYNYTSYLIELYELLRKYYPAFDSPKLKKELVFERLFPNTPFNNKKMRHTLSEFTLLAEEFLVALKIREEQFLKKKLLTEAYGQRNIYDLFERNTYELVVELQKEPIRIETYSEISGLCRKLFFHPLTPKNKLSNPSLHKAMQYLDQSFALQKLSLSTEMKARQNFLQEDHQIEFLDATEEAVANSKLGENPILLIYIKLLTLFAAQDTKTFMETKEVFQNSVADLAQGEQSGILNYLLNFSIPKVNSGDQFYYRQVFELYQLGLKEKLLIRDNRITDYTFTNIIAIGSGLKEYEWTRTFIEEYECYLDEDIRSGAKALGLAFWHFHKREFSNVVDVLVNEKFAQVIHQLRSRSLQLRAHYELFQQNDSYFEFLISSTYAFEKFIRRNEKISDTKAEGYLNLINYIRKLANAKMTSGTSMGIKRDIQLAMKDKKRFVAKKWLEEKVEEL